MKRLIVACFLFTSLLFYSVEISGQFINVPIKIPTPFGPRTIQHQVYSPWMRVNYNNNPGVSNPKYKFHIRFVNDSLIEAKARINIEDSINKLEWGKKEKQFSIKPADTKEIYRFDDLGRKISGIPHDSTCWLFVVKTGKIKTFSVIADIEFPMIAYIQKGDDGPILQLTTENLVPMVADKEKALNLLRKDKLLKAIDLYNRE